jgi:hypothetical protein
MVEKQRRASRRLSVIVAQQPTETISAHDCPALVVVLGLRSNPLVVEALMIALVMIMGQVLLDRIIHNWLQVFRRADATLLGSERRRPHQTRAVREEKCGGL